MVAAVAVLIWFITILFYTLYWLNVASKIPPLSYSMVYWVLTYVIVFVFSVIILLIIIIYILLSMKIRRKQTRWMSRC